MTIEKRVQILEDIEAIKTVKGKYALYADPQTNAEGMASLYTEDGECVVERFGTFKGREEIRAFLSEENFTWMFHCIMPQTIEVHADGVTADAVFYLWELANHPNRDGGGDTAVWIAGKYNDTFKKVGGAWFIARSELKLEMISPYEKGWVKQRFIV
jgi:ketosteroid isomerase-like protein